MQKKVSVFLLTVASLPRQWKWSVLTGSAEGTELCSPASCLFFPCLVFTDSISVTTFSSSKFLSGLGLSGILVNPHPYTDVDSAESIFEYSFSKWY